MGSMMIAIWGTCSCDLADVGSLDLRMIGLRPLYLGSLCEGYYGPVEAQLE
jgi:hypothetical protein